MKYGSRNDLYYYKLYTTSLTHDTRTLILQYKTSLSRSTQVKSPLITRPCRQYNVCRTGHHQRLAEAYSLERP